MTTGYLWTEQFKECQLAVTEGRPQSMELDEKSLEGHWSTDLNSGMEFFIINDAIFSKLCILGDDVEPCFEGASVTAPEVSSRFTNDRGFRATLFTMMQELYSVLEGGKENMENVENVVEVQDNPVQEDIVENQVSTEEPVVEAEPTETIEEEIPAVEEEPVVEEAAPEVEEPVVEPVEEPAPAEETGAAEFNLQEELDTLRAQYAALEAERNELLAFKNEIIESRKDELIASFSMLSDEDKAEVVNNKASLSLDEIESKLSVVCYRKKVNFSANAATETEVEEPAVEAPVVNFNLNPTAGAPEWLSAVERTIANRG